MFSDINQLMIQVDDAIVITQQKNDDNNDAQIFLFRKIKMHESYLSLMGLT